MKKATLIAAGAVLAFSLGTLVVCFDRSVGSAGASTDEQAEVPARVTEPVSPPALDLALPETEARAAVVRSTPPESTTSIDRTGKVIDVRGRPLGGVGITPNAGSILHIPSEGLERPAVTTHSSSDGTFQLERRVEPSRIVTDAAWVPVAVSSATRSGSRSAVLVVAPAINLAGAVVDARGTPLSGVRISLVHATVYNFGGGLTGLRHIDWLESTSDETGRFDRRDLPAKLGRLRFEKQGYLTRDLYMGELDRHDLRVTLELSEFDYVVTGRVLAPDGAPVEGALVGLGERTTRSALGGTFELRVPCKPNLDDDDPLWAAHPPWRTKVVEKVGTALKTDPDKALEYELVFEGETLAIGGRIVDTKGEPVEGIAVYIWRQRELMPGSSAEELAVPEDREQLHVGPGLRVWSESDAEGRFRLEGLGDGSFMLQLLDLERFATWTTGAIRAGAEDVVLTLPADFVRARVTGRVVDRSGAGVSGVTITPQLLAYWSTTSVKLEGDGRAFETDAEGRFTLTDVSGMYLILSLEGGSIMPSGYAVNQETGIEIVVDRMCHFRVVLTDALEQATTLEVLDAGGQTMNVATLEDGEYDWAGQLAFEGGRTRVAVGQAAATLVLYDDSHTRLARVPIALRPGVFNTIDLFAHEGARQ